MRVTAKQVAKDLGLSTATVSLALNNRPGVNEETKQRVLNYMNQLTGNFPTQQKSQGCVKILIYVRKEQFYRNTIDESTQRENARLVRSFQEVKMEMKVFYVYDASEINQIIRESQFDDTSGIILSLDEAPERILDEVTGTEIPVIVYDTELTMNSENFHVINLHNIQGIDAAMDYLRSKGKENIVYFYNTETVFNFAARREAFARYLFRWKRELPEAYMIRTGGSKKEVEEVVEKYLLKCQKLPDAILMENFIVSTGTIEAIKKCGVQIPQDISLLGIDELDIYGYSDTRLTCISMPVLERNQITVKYLSTDNAFIREGASELLLGTKLIIGDTVQ